MVVDKHCKDLILKAIFIVFLGSTITEYVIKEGSGESGGSSQLRCHKLSVGVTNSQGRDVVYVQSSEFSCTIVLGRIV